jgi:pyruvate dehydrogenase E2 component (dihydrolipoyllysine-residue acetyltransferase)
VSRSNREIPHYYLETPIDMRPHSSGYANPTYSAPVTDRLLRAVFLLKAVALPVREVPEVNGFWLRDGVPAARADHLGLAIALRTGGLVTPAIDNTDARSLNDLNAALKNLVQRARRRIIAQLGDLRRHAHVRALVIATLAGNHRATDGHRGGLFLAAIDRLLQKPDGL